MCEGMGHSLAVQSAPDQVNLSKSESPCQPDGSYSVFYCAKRYRVPVSDGRYFAVVDEADYPLVAAHKWYVLKSLRNTYAQGKDGQLMHRLITGATVDEIKVDHRDNDGLNNTRENLRVGTQSQNLANQRKQKDCQTPYKGVCTVTGSKKFRAMIGKDGKREYLGSFATAEEAARAYNKRAVELFGPFAGLNVIPSPA